MITRFQKPLVLVTLLTVCTSACIIIALILHANSKQRGVRKLLMPGSYLIHLPARTHFSVWYFWVWPSKGIREKFDTVSIEIATPAAELGRANIRRPGDTQNMFGNIGRLEFEIETGTDCTVCVKCDKRCIVVLAPSSSWMYHPELGIDSFYGSFDDSNFDQSPVAQKHQKL